MTKTEWLDLCYEREQGIKKIHSNPIKLEFGLYSVVLENNIIHYFKYKKDKNKNISTGSVIHKVTFENPEIILCDTFCELNEHKSNHSSSFKTIYYINDVKNFYICIENKFYLLTLDQTADEIFLRHIHKDGTFFMAVWGMQNYFI